MKGARLELPSSELAKMNKLFRSKATEINKFAQEGLNRVAIQVKADAQKGLKESKSIASGQLINSIFIRPQKDLSIDVTAEAAHSYWVEFGRKAGGMPPIKPILEWIKKKGLSDTTTAAGGRRKRGADFYKAATSLAWAIAMSIKQKGTKARPFLFPAFRKNEADMMKVIGDAIKKTI